MCTQTERRPAASGSASGDRGIASDAAFADVDDEIAALGDVGGRGGGDERAVSVDFVAVDDDEDDDDDDAGGDLTVDAATTAAAADGRSIVMNCMTCSRDADA